MTAKIVSILLALLTLISGTAAASFDPETDLQTQHGYILEMLDDGSFLLLNQDNQTVQVNTDENTVTDLAEPLHAGQYVVVDYDGKLTRSLPAQLYAQHIFGATLKGIVSAVNEREVTLIRPSRSTLCICPRMWSCPRRASTLPSTLTASSPCLCLHS